MKLLLITAFFTLLSFLSFSQEFTQTVKGNVTDLDTKTPLPTASVILLDSDPLLGNTTDMDGNFRLENVPTGRRSFLVSFLGYDEVYIYEVLVGTGREVFLKVEMKESLVALEEVTVRANKDKSEPLNSMATISAQQLTVESTSRIAAGINDPGRTAQSFAGVSAADDENNELVIRGNSPRGMLWRMEGVAIPNPNHFSNGEGGSGGGVSALSTQVLANSDFYTGAFPAEYGNALSGVFDLQLRNGNNEKREYALQLGVLGLQAAAEGPIVKGGDASYLVNYRYSTLKLLSHAGIDISGGDIVPDFQDLSFKIHLPTQRWGRFSIWGLGGLSTAGYTAEKDSTLWKYNGDRHSETEKHRLGIAGFTHNYLFPDNKTYLKTVAAYSYTDNQLFQDSLGNAYSVNLLHHEQFAYKTFTINSFLNHKFDPRNIVRAGVTFTQQAFDLDAKHLNAGRNEVETFVSNSGHTRMYESYLQWQHRLNESLEVNTGLHATLLAINQDLVVEPRIGVKWEKDSKSTFTFGAGLHSRAEPVSVYLAEKRGLDDRIINPNKELKFTKAFHLVAGYNWNFAPDFRLKTEVYYQYLYDVPVQKGDTTGTISSLNFSSGYSNETFVNEGKGRNYGVELTLEKFFSNNYYLLATTSLFESKYRMPDGIERNTRFNSKYIVNLVGGKEFPMGKNKQNILGLNVRMILRGGYRSIPVDEEASLTRDIEVLEYERAFETKVPDYFRVDFGVSYRKNMPDWAWILSLDIQNLTNRANTWEEYYSPETGKMETVTMLGLIPVLNYRVEF